MTDVVRGELSLNDCRAVAEYSARCAQSVLPVFEQRCPSDRRPHDAIDAALLFARGSDRTALIRDRAWSALRAAAEAAKEGEIAASEAARAAVAAAGAAYLHPLAKATQVKHILGSAAHAIRAIEITRPSDGGSHLEMLIGLATSQVSDVLRRYPSAPLKGGRIGELIREIDAALRRSG
ncbi:MAG: exonuclease SbcC [Sphingomonas sp.]|uniref:Exonuclease SbcC n=1 Tax=Sphingomonas adhaesiva TaxID=28212 RepID=A0A2A4I8J6_9SPHN|nr:exonuclease SbcC [Sphingomonas adhaesiva]PZU75681.1 MAG: exonuclease SbcC [Sphingomonas sp.]